MHESYTVYCSNAWSSRDFETRVEADDYFNQAIKSGVVTFVVLYGWMANSECLDELRSWVA